MIKYLFIVCFLVFAAVSFSRADSLSCAFPISAVFSEDAITMTWPDYPNADAYDVYADIGQGFFKANFSLVKVRPRFSFLWTMVNGVKERTVKGYNVSLYVVPLFEKKQGKDTSYSMGPQSCWVHNDYFAGHAMVLDSFTCAGILQKKQLNPRLFEKEEVVRAVTFCSKYAMLARDIDVLYKSKVDPKDEGACVPFSTMVSKYFSASGIPCYRVQGLFMEKFHSFNLVVIDNVEYILDFTADQYVPKSAPVFIPRDNCFIDSTGHPTNAPLGTFTKMYLVEKVFSGDQIEFTDIPKAREYQRLLDSLVRK